VDSQSIKTGSPDLPKCSFDYSSCKFRNVIPVHQDVVPVDTVPSTSQHLLYHDPMGKQKTHTEPKYWSTERSGRAGQILECRRQGIEHSEKETNIAASFLQYWHSNFCKFHHWYLAGLPPLTQHNIACLRNLSEEGSSFWTLLSIVL